MANRGLEWMMTLVDRFSGPARRITNSLSGVTRQIQETKKAAVGGDTVVDKVFADKTLVTKLPEASKSMLGEMGGELRKLLGGVFGREGGQLLGGAFGSALPELAALGTGIGAVVAGVMLAKEAFEKIVDVIAEAVAKVGELTYEWSKFAIETAAFKENTMVSLETVLGSARNAKSLFGATVNLADRLPIKTKEALEIETRFALAGFKDQATLQKLLVGASDVQALRGEEGVQGFVRQVSDIAAVGLSDRHLLYLSQESGIPENLIFDQLRHLTGVTGTDEQIKKMVSQQRFDRNTGVTAVMRALAAVQGGQLGTLSGKLGQTLEGRLSTLKSRPFEMFQDFDKTLGYGSLKGALGNLVDLLEPSSPFGKDLKSTLQATFGGMLQAAFGDLSGPAGRQSIQAVLTRALGLVRAFGSVITAVITNVKTFGGAFLEGIGPAIDAFTQSMGMAGDQGRDLNSIMTVLGYTLGVLVGWLLDIVSGFVMFGSHVMKVIDDVASGVYDIGELLAGNPSPLLKDVVSGFTQPAAAAAAGAPPTHQNVHVEQHFHINGSDADTDGLAKRLDDTGRSGLRSFFEELAHARGSYQR